jgi:N-acetylneuraminate synthase
VPYKKRKHVFIIAEAGLNHNANLNTAKTLVNKASEIGADAIKFQLFKAESMVSQTKDENQYKLLKSLELGFNEHKILFNLCNDLGIAFLSSPFDEESADFLDDLGISAFKIASGELTNIPLIKHIAKKNKPIILSTGMSRLTEIEEAVTAIKKHNNQKITLLHCVSEYPTNPEYVNLLAMKTMYSAFKIDVGYSDHTLGIDIPIGAVALGAVMIEKHFTLDNNMDGPDHKLSLAVDDFKKMVNGIRIVEKALGSGIKQPTKKEDLIKNAARKSIVAQTNIAKGSIILENDIAIKRPGIGIAPKYKDIVIGKKVVKNILKDDVLTWNHLLTIE